MPVVKSRVMPRTMLMKLCMEGYKTCCEAEEELTQEYANSSNTEGETKLEKR